jgi:hypothetical protein
MRIATKYCVEKLQGVCAEFLEEGVNLDNAIQMFENGVRMMNDPTFGLTFIEENAKAVITSDSFVELSKERLIVLLQSSDLKIKETDLWQSVVRWGRTECKRKKADDLKSALDTVIPHMRFPLFNVMELSTFVTPLNVLSSEQMLELYTYIACKESKDSEKKNKLPKVSFPTEPRAATAYVFKWARCGAQGRLTNNNSSLVSNGGGYCCSIADGDGMAPNTGQYYWECKVDNLGTTSDWQMAFGVATQALQLDQYMSASAAGWAYFNQACRCHQSGSSTDAYGQRYNTGDIIGVLFDSDKGELSFWRNRQALGICYSNIREKVWAAGHVNSGASHSINPDACMP